MFQSYESDYESYAAEISRRISEVSEAGSDDAGSTGVPRSVLAMSQAATVSG